MDLYEEYAQEPVSAGDVRVENLKQMAKELVDIGLRITDAEAEMTELKKQRELLRRFKIPELMAELGLSAITAGNHRCEIETTVSAKLPTEQERKDAAINWLVNNGHGGIVKRLLTVELPKGDAAAEAVLIDAVHDAAPDLHADVAYGAHHSSYAALMRQLVKRGDLLPTELLGVTIETLAKVTDQGK